MPSGLTLSGPSQTLSDSTGRIVGLLGADGREYLIGTTLNTAALASQAMYNPGSVTITGGSATVSSMRCTSFLSALTDSSGTPGNATQNVMRGRAAFAAASSSVTITNSQVAANSTILISLGGTDATLTSVRVTPGAGSFVVTGNAAATAATVFDYVVVQN